MSKIYHVKAVKFNGMGGSEYGHGQFLDRGEALDAVQKLDPDGKKPGMRVELKVFDTEKQEYIWAGHLDGDWVTKNEKNATPP